jgi:uncharacterized protein YggT (Ycf19 family)
LHSRQPLFITALRMILIHQILNIACLLLWLSWRSMRFVPPASGSSFSLLSTLKPTEPQFAARWLYLAALIALLLIRSLFYWHVGSAVNWTPAIDLVAITLPFRSDRGLLMLLFSGLSFGLLLAGFYAWLLLISSANRAVKDTEPLQRLLRFHLSWLEHCPAIVKLLLPPLVAALLWALLNPYLASLDIIPAPASNRLLWQQAALLGLAALLIWKFLLLGLLVLHSLNSYVYLGNASFWNFVNITTRNLLGPISWLPLRIGKADFAPVLAIALVTAISTLGNQWLPKLYERLPF